MLQQNNHNVKINELSVSRAGLGTVKFGRNQGVKYPSAFDLPEDRTIVELLALAKSWVLIYWTLRPRTEAVKLA